MKLFIRAIKQIFTKGSSSATKIILLAFGLAMSLILIAKLYFEKTYEGYVPNSNRTYMVISNYFSNDKWEEFDQTAGAIAPGIKASSPAVEVATRFTPLGKKNGLFHKFDEGKTNGSRFQVEKAIIADTNFFEIFRRKIYVGNEKQVLKTPQAILVSHSLAQKMGGEAAVIGTTIVRDNSPEVKLTIEGVYEDFPKNSMLSGTEVIVPMVSIGKFTFDGSNNWVGNDRYTSVIRLNEGQRAENVRDGIVKMCKANLPQEELQKAGVKIDFLLTSIKDYHASDNTTKRLCNILLILTLVVLLASSLNYILIAISEMVHKAKTIAVHKCYGASSTSIYSMLLSEALVNILFSLAIAIVILATFSSALSEILGTSLLSLVTMGSLIVLLAVCALVFVVCGAIPGAIYSKIPVATAFRRYKENSRTWKLILLFIQFISSTFFISLLLVVIMQYSYVINFDTGYSYKKLAYVDMGKVDRSKIDWVNEEVGRLPFVESRSVASCLPFEGASGNNIQLPGDDREYMNVSDLYSVGNGYFKLMGIPIVAGRNFDEENPNAREILVSESFAEKMATLANWKDGSIGKVVQVTEHSHEPNEVYTICGIYRDYLIGTLNSLDTRPSVQFFYKSESDRFTSNMSIVLIKFKEITPSNIEAINRIIKQAAPEKDLSLKLYSDEYESLYADSKNFRNTVTYAGFVVLLITIIGLIGYSRDEINRRRSEVAIRKIHGATLNTILKLFIQNILKMAIPAIAAGAVMSYYVSEIWLGLYAKKIALHWWIFAICALITLLIVVGVVLFATYRAANRNPVDNLKSE